MLLRVHAGRSLPEAMATIPGPWRKRGDTDKERFSANCKKPLF
jgi:hypothetical protein